MISLPISAQISAVPQGTLPVLLGRTQVAPASEWEFLKPGWGVISAILSPSFSIKQPPETMVE